MQNKEHLLTQSSAIFLLALFGFTMYAVVKIFLKKDQQIDSYLLANRTVPVWRGALSIAVSWIWAPAIFICSLQSFTKGLPGIFWFTAPNILCFFVFVPIMLKLKKTYPAAYSVPNFISEFKFPNNKKVHLAFILLFFLYQLGAIVINCLAGGNLLNAISGLDIKICIILFTVIPLLYTFGTGLKASIFTDVIQMLMLLIFSLILVPVVFVEGGSFSALWSGLGGLEGNRSLLNLDVAYAMGIPMTIGLIAGPICDQMFFQRGMATKYENITRTFVYGGLLFGVVPIALSILGFIAVPLVNSGALVIQNEQLVGLELVQFLLPKFFVYLFVLMAFAGLCSTLDSALCAVSSLGSIDIYKKYFNPKASEEILIKNSRIWMILISILGCIIALLEPKLLWVFLIYGTIASSAMFPTIFSLFSKTISANTVFYAIIISLIIATPISIYANVVNDTNWIVLASILSVFIGLGVCLLGRSWKSTN